MQKPKPLKNVLVEKDAFDAILRRLIASPPVRQNDLKPKRKRQAKRMAQKVSQ